MAGSSDLMIRKGLVGKSVKFERIHRITGYLVGGSRTIQQCQGRGGKRQGQTRALVFNYKNP